MRIAIHVGGGGLRNLAERLTQVREQHTLCGETQHRDAYDRGATNDDGL